MTDNPLIRERGESYGSPIENHDRIAKMWSGYLGVKVTAHDVALMCVMIKISRSKADPSKDDNYDDGMAYWEIAKEVR